MTEYKGVRAPEGYDRHSTNYRQGWRDGVDSAKAADTPAGTLKLTGWSKDIVRAFAHITQDDPDTARGIVRALSPRDRATLLFTLREMTEMAEDEDMLRRTEDRRRVRRDREREINDAMSFTDS